MYFKNEYDETGDGIPCYTKNAWEFFYVRNILKMEEELLGKFMHLQRYCITRRTLDLLPAQTKLDILVFSLSPDFYWSWSIDPN